jgi:4-hydroxybenzoate polyprenyltransferase
MSAPTKLLSYARLFRVPNVFTAMADVTMGYLFVRATLAPLPCFACLLLSSCMLYSAGMVLNDVHDFPVDARERPHRPLPAGQIALSLAKLMAVLLLVGGVALACLAGLFVEPRDVGPTSLGRWRGAAVSVALVISIVLYDVVLKEKVCGPTFMGLCRSLNVLLGMSLAAPGESARDSLLGYTAPQLLVAAGIGVYIWGVTWFARGEARTSHRAQLTWGVALMVAGLALLASFPHFGEFADGRRALALAPAIAWPALIGLIGFSIVRRCLQAIVDPAPERVQVAVKQCIVSLIVLDASVCLAVRSPVWWAIGILALIGPMLILGRRVYST